MENRFGAWDGKPLRRYWKPNTWVKPGETILRTKQKRYDTKLFPGYTHDVWTGQWKGYGKAGDGGKLFRSLQTALAFACAAHRAGYRRK